MFLAYFRKLAVSSVKPCMRLPSYLYAIARRFSYLSLVQQYSLPIGNRTNINNILNVKSYSMSHRFDFKNNNKSKSDAHEFMVDMIKRNRWLSKKYLDMFVEHCSVSQNPAKSLQHISEKYRHQRDDDSLFTSLLPRSDIDVLTISKLRVAFSILRFFDLEFKSIFNCVSTDVSTVMGDSFSIDVQYLSQKNPSIETDQEIFSIKFKLSELNQLQDDVETVNTLNLRHPSVIENNDMVASLTSVQRSLLRSGIFLSDLRHYTPSQCSVWEILRLPPFSLSNDACKSLLDQHEWINPSTTHRLEKLLGMKSFTASDALNLINEKNDDELIAYVYSLEYSDVLGLTPSQHQILSKYKSSGLSAEHLRDQNWHEGSNLITSSDFHDYVPKDTGKNIFYAAFECLYERGMNFDDIRYIFSQINTTQATHLIAGLDVEEVLQYNISQCNALILWKHHSKNHSLMRKVLPMFVSQGWFKNSTSNFLSDRAKACQALIETIDRKHGDCLDTASLKEISNVFTLIGALSELQVRGINRGLTLHQISSVQEPAVISALVFLHDKKLTSFEFESYPWFKGDVHVMGLKKLVQFCKMDPPKAMNILQRMKGFPDHILLFFINCYIKDEAAVSSCLNTHLPYLNGEQLYILLVCSMHGLQRLDLLNYELPKDVISNISGFSGALKQLLIMHHSPIHALRALSELSSDHWDCIALGYDPALLEDLSSEQMKSLSGIGRQLRLDSFKIENCISNQNEYSDHMKYK